LFVGDTTILSIGKEEESKTPSNKEKENGHSGLLRGDWVSSLNTGMKLCPGNKSPTDNVSDNVKRKWTPL
jgi:hypothetical protein